MLSQFRDQVIKYRYVFAVRLSEMRMATMANEFALPPYWVSPQGQGLLLMKTSGVRWKSRSIRFPIRAAVSGARNYVITVLARRAGYFYFILSRTFGLSTRIYTPPPSSPFCYFETRCACKGWWN